MDKSAAIDNSASTEVGSGCVHPRHPLEFIPYFRRFKRGLLRNLLYTLIWSTGFAVVFTVLALVFNPDWKVANALWANFVIANCIGFLIHGGFELAEHAFPRWIQQQTGAMRALYYSTVSVIGVFAGYWLGFTLLNWKDARGWMFSGRGATSILLLSVIISAILAAIFLMRERQARAEVAFQRERARVEAAEHQVHLAKLKLLEAQVEPHFLHNTLANVISLIDSEPPDAKRMIERLIDYLRRAAATGADGTATLGTQLELLKAYLDLIVLRMGPRLSYQVDVPRDLAVVALPPMLLQPLVENAIKHGLEPKVAGGRVTIAARRDGELLRLTVADDGQGFTAAPEGRRGIGLANLRERLASLYGDRARMVIEDTRPGTTVTLSVPVGAGL